MSGTGWKGLPGRVTREAGTRGFQGREGLQGGRARKKGKREGHQGGAEREALLDGTK